MNQMHDIFVVTSAGIVWFAILTLPRWLVTSLHRGRLWKLRDQLYDDMRHGAFPGHEAQALKIVTLAEHAILAVPFFTPWNVRRFSKLIGTISPEDRRLWAEKVRLDLQDVPSLEFYRDRIHTMLSQQLLTGSWIGLLMTAGALARALTHKTIRRRREPRPDITDETVSVPLRHMKVEVKRSSALGEQVLNPHDYLPLVLGDDHDEVLTAV